MQKITAKFEIQEKVACCMKEENLKIFEELKKQGKQVWLDFYQVVEYDPTDRKNYQKSSSDSQKWNYELNRRVDEILAEEKKRMKKLAKEQK